MTNRFFILLTLCCLVFGGCPSPESEERNKAFEGTLHFTSNGMLLRMDLKSGTITPVTPASGPAATVKGRIIVSAPSVGLIELDEASGSRRIIMPEDRADLSRHNDGFSDPQLHQGQIAYHHASRTYVVDAASGAVLHTVPDAVRPQWMNDGRLLIKRGEELHAIQLGNDVSTIVANIGDGRDHVIDPTGSRIAIVEGKELFVMNIDGSNLKVIMTGHTELRYPTWSKDGTHIIVNDGCDLKLFKVSGGMVQSFKGRYFTFKDEHCPDAAQMSWQ